MSAATTSDSGIRTEVADGVCRVTLDRPHVRNALSTLGRTALATTLRAADRDPDVRVVVVSGSGGHFCAGGDINEFVVERTHAEARRYATEFAQPVFTVMRAMTTPTIACVEGVAAGAGMFLALGCDFVVAAHGSRFIASHLNLGVPPDWGSLWLMPRLVGLARAKSTLLTRRPLAAEVALTWGLIAECVPAADLAAVVDGYVADLVAAPSEALGIARQGLDRSFDMGLESFLEWEADVIAQTMVTDEHRRRVLAFIQRPRAVPGSEGNQR